MKKLSFLLLGIAILGMANGQTHQLVKKWESDTLFKVPESVLFDASSNILYVTNIDGTDPWGKDGKGSVGKMSPDGKIIEVEWVRGLHAPKGMGLYKGKLYVADMERLVVINTATGAIENNLTLGGAQGLNDVAIDPNGTVYITDSRAKRLYRFSNGVAEVYLDSLKGPNGVLCRGDEIFLLDAGSMFKVEKNKSLTKMAEGMDGGTDGVENTKGNDFIVSCWAGVIWYINADGTKEKLLDTRTEKRNTADIGFDPKTQTVYVPTFWKNSVVAYEVK